MILFYFRLENSFFSNFILIHHFRGSTLTMFVLIVSESTSRSLSHGLFFSAHQYLAPEVLRKQPYDNTVDWWCLGSVLYEMLFGLVRLLFSPPNVYKDAVFQR